MSPTFSGGGFTMEVVNADDRDELIRVSLNPTSRNFH